MPGCGDRRTVMHSIEERGCEACQAAFSWRPVVVEGREFCCEPCSLGRECSCLEHSHLHSQIAMGSRAGAKVLGATEGEL